ncbi:2993_t:CDS:2, partial [Acaulospora morrowiae]
NMSWYRTVAKFLVVSIGKKAFLLGISKVFDAVELQAQSYGIPHIYRRTLEINRKVIRNPYMRKRTTVWIRQGFLIPNKIDIILGLAPKKPNIPPNTLPPKTLSPTKPTSPQSPTGTIRRS